MSGKQVQICFATNNAHKLGEVQSLLPSNFKIVSLAEIGCKDELPEDQDTLEGNSLQKAQFVFDNYGISCFADDTGLEVDALGGEPGVYSARYAGPQRNSDDNIDLLLKKLEGKPRTARFRTVVTLLMPDKTIQFEGTVEGDILSARRGLGGFGYDPVFKPVGLEKSMAELTMAEKNLISHRGIATRKLVDYLKNPLKPALG